MQIGLGHTHISKRGENVLKHSQTLNESPTHTMALASSRRPCSRRRGLLSASSSSLLQEWNLAKMSHKWEDEHLLSMRIKSLEWHRGEDTPPSQQGAASWWILLAQGRLSPLHSGSCLPSAAAAVSVIPPYFILQKRKKKKSSMLQGTGFLEAIWLVYCRVNMATGLHPSSPRSLNSEILIFGLQLAAVYCEKC